jgi:hypothetical protein
MTLPFHLKIDLSPSFIFYLGCLTFLFYPPTLSFPVSVTPLSYSVIFLSSLKTKNPLHRPKLTTLFYSCAISPALYHIYHRIRIMLLLRPVAKGVKVYKSLSAPTTYVQNVKDKTSCWEACYTLHNPHVAYVGFLVNYMYVDEIQVWLKSDKNNGHFTWRPTGIYVYISPFTKYVKEIRQSQKRRRSGLRSERCLATRRWNWIASTVSVFLTRTFQYLPSIIHPLICM